MCCMQQKGNTVLSSFVNVCFLCYVFGFVQRYVNSKIKMYVLRTILYGVQISALLHSKMWHVILMQNAYKLCSE